MRGELEDPAAARAEDLRVVGGDGDAATLQVPFVASAFPRRGGALGHLCPGLTHRVDFEVVGVDGGPHCGPSGREVGEHGHEFGRAERRGHVQTDGGHWCSLHKVLVDK